MINEAPSLTVYVALERMVMQVAFVASGVCEVFDTARNGCATLSERAIAQGGARVRTNALVLMIALAMPVIVHLAPWGGGVPLGAFLLPMFWAAFVAVYFYGVWAGLAVALFGPVVNTFLTKFPELRLNTVMSFELVIFVLFAWLVLRRARGFWLLAPLSYLVAKGCSCGLRAAGVEAFGNIGSAGEFFVRSVSNGALGLVCLGVINFALVRGWFGNRGAGGGHGGPEAAA